MNKTHKRARSLKPAPRSHRVSARSDFSDRHARTAAAGEKPEVKIDFDPYALVADAIFGMVPLRLMGEDSANRKRYPITSGFLDYFPDAVQAGAEVSFVGNLKHNPGEPMHHARGKSSDHADCIARHLVERGGFVDEEIDGKVYRIRHSAALFWRAGALLQEELEAEGLCSLPRAAKLP